MGDNKIHQNGVDPMEHRMVVPWMSMGCGEYSQYDEKGVSLFMGLTFKTPTGDMVFPIRNLPTSPEAENKFKQAVVTFMEALLDFQSSEIA